MFLSEGYVNYAEENVSADPIYAMQIMQEATDDWNDICMKMIKLEHTAIMREDAELLAEGAKEAIIRFKNNVIVFARKMIEYLERVRVQWSKLQASIASKFVNQTAVSNMQKKMGEVAFKNNLKINLPKDWDTVVGIVTNMSSATSEITKEVLTKVANGESAFASGANKSGFETELKANKTTRSLTTGDEDLDAKIDRIVEKYKFNDVEGEANAAPLTWDHVSKALKFLKERPVAIKNIEAMKKAVTQIQNAKIKDLDTEKEKRVGMRNELVSLQRAFNKLIIKINKMTSTAVKICKLANDTKDSGISSADKRAAYDQAKKSKGLTFKGNAEEPATKAESVLDLFY